MQTQKLNNLHQNNLLVGDIKNSLFMSFLLHIIFCLIICSSFTKKPILVAVPIEIINIQNIENQVAKQRLDPKIAEQDLQNEKIKEYGFLKKDEKIKIKKDLEKKFFQPNIEKNTTRNSEVKKEEIASDNTKNVRRYDDSDNDFVPKLSDNLKTLKTSQNAAIKENLFTSDLKFEKEFPFSYYARIVRNKINDNWQKPFISGTNAKAIIYFQILRDGTIKNIKIYKNSGHSDFDDAAVNSVIKSNQFPSLPDDYKGNDLGVYFSFEFI